MKANRGHATGSGACSTANIKSALKLLASPRWLVLYFFTE